MKKKKRPSKTKKPTAEYDLVNIRNLIDQQKVRIRANAERSALDDFGWGIDDIKAAMKKLKPKHFCKSADHEKRPGTVMDYYKARGIKAEDIYTHFYIDDSDGFLIISSFKRK
jgi:hypothetical protein